MQTLGNGVKAYVWGADKRAVDDLCSGLSGWMCSRKRSSMGDLSENSAVFLVRTKGQLQHTNKYVAAEAAREAAQAGRAQAGAFQVSGEAILFGAIFLLCLLTLVSLILVRLMETLTLREMITKEGEAQTKRRKIYSLKRKDLTGVLTKKFMFSRKKTLSELYCLCLWEVFFFFRDCLSDRKCKGQQ